MACNSFRIEICAPSGCQHLIFATCRIRIQSALAAENKGRVKRELWSNQPVPLVIDDLGVKLMAKSGVQGITKLWKGDPFQFLIKVMDWKEYCTICNLIDEFITIGMQTWHHYHASYGSHHRVTFGFQFIISKLPSRALWVNHRPQGYLKRAWVHVLFLLLNTTWWSLLDKRYAGW